MERRPNFQTVAWFNDLRQRSALDLDPSYQRPSVWNQTFKNYFIDTGPRLVTLGPWRVRGWDRGNLLALILLGLLVAGCGAADGSGSADEAYRLVGGCSRSVTMSQSATRLPMSRWNHESAMQSTRS